MRSFSDWQIRRLRERLSRFRKIERLNDRDRPWERVAMDVLYSEKLPAGYVDAEDVGVLAESLRRFANGRQVPNADRLNAVWLFLTEKGYLSEADLEEDLAPLHAALAMQEYLRLTPTEAENIFRHLNGTYEAAWESVNGTAVSQLEFSVTASTGVIQASERFAFSRDQRTVQQARKPTGARGQRPLMKVTATGWAFSIPGFGLVVLLRDPVEHTHSCYIVLTADFRPWRPSLYHKVRTILLLRNAFATQNVCDRLRNKKSELHAELADWERWGTRQYHSVT